jgi:hypothetical protein
LLTAVPFLRRMTWQLPDTYHSAGHGRGTATLKFYEGRDILSPTLMVASCRAISVTRRHGRGWRGGSSRHGRVGTT